MMSKEFYARKGMNPFKTVSHELKPPEITKRQEKDPAKFFGNCSLCKEGKILEKPKAFYCSKRKEGYEFTFLKNTLDRYDVFLDKK